MYHVNTTFLYLPFLHSWVIFSCTERIQLSHFSYNTLGSSREFTWIKLGVVNSLLILCYNCREVANVAFDDLPSSRSGRGRYSCDGCTKNGVYLQASKVFCTICCLKYCADHEKVHCRNITKFMYDNNKYLCPVNWLIMCH